MSHYYQNGKPTYQCKAGQASTNRMNKRRWLVVHGLAEWGPMRYKSIEEAAKVLP